VPKNLNLPLCGIVPEAIADFAKLTDDESRMQAAQWCAKCGVKFTCYKDKVVETSPTELEGELWAGVYFEEGKRKLILDIGDSESSSYEQVESLVASLRKDLIDTNTQYYGRHDKASLYVIRRLEGIYERDWKYPEVQELCRRMIIAMMRHPDIQVKAPITKELENLYATLNAYFETEVDKMYEHTPWPQQEFLVRYLTFRNADDYPKIRDQLAALGLPGSYGSWQIVHNPRDPIAAGERFAENLKQLDATNPGVPRQVLAEVVRNYPTAAEAELSRLREEASRLISGGEYHDIPEEVVLLVILGRKDPDKAIQTFKYRLGRVQDYVGNYEYLIDNLTPLEVMRITARIWRPWDTLWSIARLKRSGLVQVSLDESREDSAPLYSKIADISPEAMSPEDLFIGEENKELLRQFISKLLSRLDEPRKLALLMWYGIDDAEVNASRPLEIEEKVAELLGCDVLDVESAIQQILTELQITPKN